VGIVVWVAKLCFIFHTESLLFAFFQLLKEEKPGSKASFWTFEYYQQFFDVESTDVLQRVLGSMFPHPNKNYLKTKIRPNPDLYGKIYVMRN